MQRRLIEEMAKLRGGKTRLQQMRKQFEDKRLSLGDELEEVEGFIDLIDKVTSDVKDAYQEASEKVTEREPVDSIGE